MERSNKTKVVCFLISVLLIMQIVPFSSFAIQSEVAYKDSITNLSENTLGTEPEILYEIVDERDEFTKVYKLSDGSYCEIISNTPIHRYSNGTWDEPMSGNFNEPTTINDATNGMTAAAQSISNVDAVSSITSNISTETKSSFSVYPLEVSLTDPDYMVASNENKVNSERAIIAVPKGIDSYVGKMRGIISVQIKVNCNDNAKTGVGGIEIHRNLLPWNGAADALYSISDSFADRKYGYNTINGSGTYSWDITDLYYCWENGIEDNYGVIFMTMDGADATFLNQFLVIQYKDIETFDESFEYTSINNGRAGEIFINEFTHLPSLKFDLFSSESEILPVAIKMMYSRNFYNTPIQYGYNWGINYLGTLEYKNTAFVWDNFDGSTIVFQATNPQQKDSLGRVKWTEPTNSFVLWVDSLKSFDADPDFSNNLIVSSEDELKYEFNKGQGRVAKASKIINKYGNKIEIGYTAGQLISYIKDGAGQKYVFEYAPHKTNGIDSLNRIVLVNSNNSDVVLGGKTQDIEFTYSNLADLKNTMQELVDQPNNSGLSDENMLLLTSVKFPDDKSVRFGYNSLGWLTSSVNIDNQKVELTYGLKNEVSENSQSSNSTEVSMTNGVKKGVKTNGNTVVEDVSFEAPFSHERGTSWWDKDARRTAKGTSFYNTNLQRVAYVDKDGSKFYYCYSINSDQSAYEIPQSDGVNLVLNSSFESRVGFNPKKAANWDASSAVVFRDKRPNETPYCMRIKDGNENNEYYAEQTIDISSVENISTGDILAIGGEGYCSGTIPESSRFFGIKVYGVYSTSGMREICSVAFDNSLYGEWQSRLSAFRIDMGNAENSLESLVVKCVLSHQSGEFYFDDISLSLVYDSDATQGDSCNCGDLCKYELGICPCECIVEEGTVCSCVSCNANTSYHISDINGNITSLTKTDGIKSMITNFNYDDSGTHITSVVDENGQTTNYSYDNATGLLTSVSDSNGSTNYAYDSMGALKAVSRAVDNLSSDSVVYTTNYGYTNDRISEITHNGFTYYFEYDSFGNCTKVCVGQPAEGGSKSLLVNYEYSDNTHSQNLNKITYANGDTITYSYANNLINWISFDDGETKAYEYEYDSSGNIKTVIDTLSDITTRYNYIVINADNTTTTYEAYVYRTSDPNTVKYCRKTVDGITYDIFADVTFSESEPTNNYYGQTGITVTSNNVSYHKRQFVTANATDYFGRKINTPANTSITKDENSDTMSSSSVIIEKDLQGNSIAKSEMFYYYDDTESSAFSRVSGFKNHISEIVDENSSSGWSDNNEYRYEYDDCGNITHIYSVSGENQSLRYRYAYNAANQLVREDNQPLNKTYVFEYDAGGNLSAKKTYAYTLEEPENIVDNIGLSYDSVWKDKLTSFGDSVITYDSLGNPTSCDGKTLEWRGRQLISLKKENQKIYYTYDSEGNCTSKTYYNLGTDDNGNETETFASRTDFVWKDGKLIYQYTNTNFTLKYLYDSKGEPYGFITKGEGVFDTVCVFYYVKNMQGDIERIIGGNTSNTFVRYKYDAWGNVDMSFSTSDFSLMLAGLIVSGNNMLTYRGYFYDMDADMYLLKSRYYNPKWGRFISLDLTETAQSAQTDVLSANLYLYCLNNPVNFTDPSGLASQKNVFIVYSKRGSDFIEQANWMKRYAYSNKNCLTRYVEKVSDFEKEWNTLSSYSVKDIHLYFHGGAGKLYFNNESMSVGRIKRLKKLNISGKVYLYSCHGGTNNSSRESAAGAVSTLVFGSRVRAVVNGNVYYRSWYQIFQRKPLTKEKNAYWADFYCDEFRGKMKVYANSIGKTWRL